MGIATNISVHFLQIRRDTSKNLIEETEFMWFCGARIGPHLLNHPRVG
jgi:hypothetical protein